MRKEKEKKERERGKRKRKRESEETGEGGGGGGKTTLLGLLPSPSSSSSSSSSSPSQSGSPTAISVLQRIADERAWVSSNGEKEKGRDDDDGYNAEGGAEDAELSSFPRYDPRDDIGWFFFVFYLYFIYLSIFLSFFLWRNRARIHIDIH